MPDLEQRITEWRRQMLAAGMKSPVPLEELEDHLRDELERQMRTGLTAENAFEVAIQRIGHPVLLGKEFTKAEANFLTRTIVILASLFAMVFGLSVVLPALGRWVQTGMLDLGPLLTGLILIITGGSAALYGIKTRQTTQGRRAISIGAIAAGSFFTTPLVLEFFRGDKTSLSAWMFCAGLAAAALLFFGSCFSLNASQSEPRSVIAE